MANVDGYVSKRTLSLGCFDTVLLGQHGILMKRLWGSLGSPPDGFQIYLLVLVGLSICLELLVAIAVVLLHGKSIDCVANSKFCNFAREISLGPGMQWHAMTDQYGV